MSNFFREKYFILLILIVVFTSFLRLFQLSKFPSGFYFDEVAVGVNSNYLATDLTDEFGNKLPDFIQIADDYRHGVIFYASVPFIKIIGLNILSVRLPTALFGILSVLATFYLVNLLTGNKKISLLSSLLLAVSPWAINLSRSSNEVLPALFFLIMASISFLLTQNGKKIYFLFMYLFLLLSWFSYSGAILMTGLYCAFYVGYSLSSKVQKKLKLLTIITVISFIIFPNFFYYLTQPKKITGRFDAVSVFAFKEPKLITEEQLRYDGTQKLPILISRVYHNKIANYSSETIQNYATHFSAPFLFGLEGGPPRYKIPHTGLLYFLDIPLLLIGLFTIFKKFTLKKSFIIFWILVGAIPAALTVEDIPNMQRSVFTMPGWQIIIAYGIYSFINSFPKKLFFRILFAAVIVISYTFFLSTFLHQLIFHQPKQQNWHRNSEWPQVVRIAEENKAKYTKINLYSTIGHYFFFFYSKDYRNAITNDEVLKRNYLENRNLWEDWTLGKYYFRHKNCIDNKEVKSKVLYSVGQNCSMPSWGRIIGEAKTSDGVTMITFFDAPYEQETIDKFIMEEKAQEKSSK